jgi:hypothetical protein
MTFLRIKSSAGHRQAAQRSSSGCDAFTIADVVVAVLILSVVTGAFYSALSSSFSMLQNTREDLRATQILMQRIEAVRLCTWEELTNFAFQASYDPLSTNSQTAGATYYGTVTLTPSTVIPNTAAYYPNITLVTVNLVWTNYNGRVAVPHNRQMQTHFARYGLQNYIWGAIP